MEKELTFGEFCKQLRLKAGMSLTDLQIKYNLHPSLISRIENNKRPPFRNEKLKRHAFCLGLQEGSADYINFMKLANSIPRPSLGSPPGCTKEKWDRINYEELKKPEPNKFGSFLRRLRIKNRITINEFSKKINMSYTYVRELERHVVPPPWTIETLNKYCEALKIKRNSKDYIKFFELAKKGKRKVSEMYSLGPNSKRISILIPRSIADKLEKIAKTKNITKAMLYKDIIIEKVLGKKSYIDI